MHHSSINTVLYTSTLSTHNCLHQNYTDIAAKKLGQGFSKAGVKEAEETFDKMVPLGADYYYVDGSSVAYLEGKKVFDKLK